MARKPKPWFRKERQRWFVTINGQQVNLGPNKKDAERRFHKLMAQRPQPITRCDSLVAIFDLFLDWTEKNRAEGTYDWYSQRLHEFARRVQTLRVNQLKVHHVESWIETKNSDGHKRGCVIAVSRALNWALKQGHIEKNPIAHMEKPKAGKRELVITEEEFSQALKRANDQQFHDLLTFCWETGCRPQEAFNLEARHLELDQSRVFYPKEEAKNKTRPRIIYLTDAALEIVQRLKLRYPHGKLFRNANGDPWNRNNVSCRFMRMKKHIGKNLCLYNFRHSFATRMLEAGVDSLIVAALMGHADLSMLGRVYAHLTQNPKNLLEQLKRA